MIRAKHHLVLGLLLSFSVPALAAKSEGRRAPAGKEAKEGAETKEAKERAAKKACLNGDATKGVELLTDLYVDTNEPIYIFNQGRCYEQSNRCEDAIVRFREYLRKTAGGSGSDRADVEKHIADCEALLAKKTEAVAPPAAAIPVPSATVAPPSPPPDQPLPTAVTASPSDSVVVAQPQVSSAPGSGLRAAGVATMAVGGAALIAGFALNLKHNSTIHDLKGDYRGDMADDAQTYKIVSMVGYGLGGACLLGGTVLYWLGWREGKTVVAPSVVEGQAGLIAGGTF